MKLVIVAGRFGGAVSLPRPTPYGPSQRITEQ